MKELQWLGWVAFVGLLGYWYGTYDQPKVPPVIKVDLSFDSDMWRGTVWDLDSIRESRNGQVCLPHRPK
jgi:hypothetical protein